MEVTRQLLTERAGKTGLCRIQFTFCWASQRLRTGQKYHPKDWDASRSRVKNKPDTYADDINQVLDDYTDLAQALHHETERQGLPLSKGHPAPGATPPLPGPARHARR